MYIHVLLTHSSLPAEVLSSAIALLCPLSSAKLAHPFSHKVTYLGTGKYIAVLMELSSVYMMRLFSSQVEMWMLIY